MSFRLTSAILTLLFCASVGCNDQRAKNNPARANKNSNASVLSAEKAPNTDTKISQPSSENAAWTPPPKPDPQQVLQEAREDAIAGRFDQSLAKQVWFHENALSIDESFYGVRLSFALSYWKDLADRYPPAKAKLEEVRDNAEQQVLKGDKADDAFADFEAINGVLGDEPRTVGLFKTVEGKDPAVSRKLYSCARPALVRAKEYKLCSKYISPDVDYPRLVQLHRANMELSSDPRLPKEHADFARQKFANDVSTLVALLVVADQKPKAEQIAAEAKKVMDGKEFADSLDKALTGLVPDPWP